MKAEAGLGAANSDPRRARLREAVAHAGHYLPAQAPLEVFVHHNTLHAFQSLPFHDALRVVEHKLGVRGYLPEARYRDALLSGRISEEDIAASLAPLAPPARWPAGLPDVQALRRAVLLHGLNETTPAGRRWQLTEAGAELRFRPDIPAAARRRILAETGGDEAGEAAALWRTCLALGRAVPRASAPPPEEPRFHRDLLLRIGDEDPNELVHTALIPFCASFLDRGQSRWSMPDRDQGFYLALCRVLTTGYTVRSAWLRDLGQRLRVSLLVGQDAEAAVLARLDELGVGDDEQAAFIEQTLLQLPGWAGMFQRLADAPGPIGRSPARITLMDFLAVRLTLDTLAYRDLAERLGYVGDDTKEAHLATLRAFCLARPPLSPALLPGAEDAAWSLFQTAQLTGLSAAALARLGVAGAEALLREVGALHRGARLRLWHEAYERHYRQEVLAAVTANRSFALARLLRRRSVRPRFQIVTCMDDRSESLRRHFEELSADHQTFGAAGFFNLAIAYQGIDDPATFPLCPVVVEPHHRIVEQPSAGDEGRAEARLRRRRRLGRLESLFVRSSRSLLWGPVVTAVSGFVAALPLLAVVFAPWWAARLQRAVRRWLFPEIRTQLTPMRPQLPRPGEDAASVHQMLVGFSVEEKASRVGTLLQNMGLSQPGHFAPLVIIIGHDSSSANNPHFAAYSCGACGGRSGGPNARLFARMANRAEVRARLRQGGVDIPDDTVFVGAVHDSCSDSFVFHDVGDLSAVQKDELHALQQALDVARRHNAHERCRRFESAPPDLSLDEALRHVEERGHDLSQARPELGHATNAACVVGRRALTRGLFLDRRVFLVSYAPEGDEGGAVLERILLAVGPVGAGINLEYFFSSVDNERLGAGTKLPYNLTALLGVMNGASSDLRTGLPRQMIEIHEPLRLLMLIEARPQTLAAIVARQPALRELVDNEWLRVVTVDPDSGALSLYTPGAGFSPWTAPEAPLPVVARSRDWYSGKRGFVPPARVLAPQAPEEGALGGGEA